MSRLKCGQGRQDKLRWNGKNRAMEGTDAMPGTDKVTSESGTAMGPMATARGWSGHRDPTGVGPSFHVSAGHGTLLRTGSTQSIS